MALTVDEIFDKIGGFGRYQCRLLGIMGYVMFIAVTFPVMIVTFLTAEPDWMCVKGYNSSICNFTEPIGLISDNYEARCSMPREAWKFVDGFTSVVTEFDLICEKSYLFVVAQSCAWAGMFFGLAFGGYAGDRFGRKITYCLPLAGVTLATWIMVYPKDFAVYIAARTFIGMTSGIVLVVGFVLLTEYSGVKDRAKLGVYSFHFWTTALLFLALMAYLLPNWRDLLLASAAICTPCIFFWWLTPESARWLLVKGRYDEAIKHLEKVAKINKKEMPDEEVKKPVVVKEGNFRHLFLNRETAKKTLIVFDILITVGLVYYGVSFGSIDLGWNQYAIFALTGFIEYPSNFGSVWAADRFGRKKTTVLNLIFACLSSIAVVLIPSEESRIASVNTIFRVIMAVFAKFFITNAYSASYVWTAELFPTFIRNMALSFGSVAIIVGSICASYVIWLIRIHPMLPFGIMAFFCLKSSVIAMFLPETNRQPTLETIEDIKAKLPPTLMENGKDFIILNEKPA